MEPNCSAAVIKVVANSSLCLQLQHVDHAGGQVVVAFQERPQIKHFLGFVDWNLAQINAPCVRRTG